MIIKFNTCIYIHICRNRLSELRFGARKEFLFFFCARVRPATTPSYVRNNTTAVVGAIIRPTVYLFPPTPDLCTSPSFFCVFRGEGKAFASPYYYVIIIMHAILPFFFLATINLVFQRSTGGGAKNVLPIFKSLPYAHRTLTSRRDE